MLYFLFILTLVQSIFFFLFAEYEGIYLDTDEIILRPFDNLMNFTFTLSHELDDNLGNALILSSPNATFISHWLNGYKTYNSAQWGYHSTFLPCELSKKYPHLLHVEGKTFIRPNYNQLPLIYQGNFNWSRNYGIHLYIRVRKEIFTFSEIYRQTIEYNHGLGCSTCFIWHKRALL